MSLSCPFIVKRQHWVDGRLVTEQEAFPDFEDALAYAKSGGVDAKIYNCYGELVRYVRRVDPPTYLYA